MSFEEALARNRPPARIGNVRLVYESSSLIGEPAGFRSPFAGAREALFVAGLGAAAACIAVVALPSDAATVPLAAGLALAAVIAVLGAIALDRRNRARRSFVLNFVAETLRVEWTERSGRPRAATVPFDDVTALRIVQRSSGHLGIEVEFHPPGRDRSRGSVTVVVIDRVPSAQRIELRTTWRLLRGAFGLRAEGDDSLLGGEPRAPKRSWIE